MKRHVFIRILNAVQSVDSYFQQREDCTGLLGIECFAEGGSRNAHTGVWFAVRRR